MADIDWRTIVSRMEGFAGVIETLGRSIGDDDARWRPTGGQWSIVEIVAHLADEETEDFRPRVERTLHDPETPWDPIDPEGAAAERDYRSRSLREESARFAQTRRESVEWLRFLLNPDWEQAHEHPSLGALRAGDLLASWAAHDALHLRQIAKRLFEMSHRDAPGFATEYAGRWGA